MSCRVVGKPRWPSGLEVVIWDAERGTPHREVARQGHVRGVRYRLAPPLGVIEGGKNVC
jgi:hypothetical protein